MMISSIDSTISSARKFTTVALRYRVVLFTIAPRNFRASVSPWDFCGEHSCLLRCFLELARGAAGDFPELACEVVAVVKTALKGGLGYAHIPVPEQFHGFADADTDDMIQRGRAYDMLKSA